MVKGNQILLAFSLWFCFDKRGDVFVVAALEIDMILCTTKNFVSFNKPAR